MFFEGHHACMLYLCMAHFIMPLHSESSKCYNKDVAALHSDHCTNRLRCILTLYSPIG